MSNLEDDNNMHDSWSSINMTDGDMHLSHSTPLINFSPYKITIG